VDKHLDAGLRPRCHARGLWKLAPGLHARHPTRRDLAARSLLSRLLSARKVFGPGRRKRDVQKCRPAFAMQMMNKTEIRLRAAELDIVRAGDPDGARRMLFSIAQRHGKAAALAVAEQLWLTTKAALAERLPDRAA
jgi:hypothetical protein